MRVMHAALASLLAFAPIAACDSDSDSSKQTADFCQSDFSATVRQGPDQGTEYAGVLTTTLDETGTKIGGDLELDGTSGLTGHVRVDGDVAAGQVTLRFHLADGRTITGSGAFGADAVACKVGTQLAGDFTGPDAADSGDWLGPLAIFLIGEGIKLAAPYACFAACSYGGNSDAYCNDLCR
ncbi:MAG: hypothetical protein U1F43_02080 [Myxococcota bacterium]